jgi:glyoxylase-like metal-dependent hydrolase (beta-lactamase superfamily II)
LLPQLAGVGYRPGDITYFASRTPDHTANANAFANATWIMQHSDAISCSRRSPKASSTRHLRCAAHAKAKVLSNEDLGVTGDGSVVVMSTPGHTPGHQVVSGNGEQGTVVLGGDLYHYPEERTTGRIPTFEFNAAQSTASRARIEQYLKDTGGTLWIEHDKATHAALPKAPRYVD